MKIRTIAVAFNAILLPFCLIANAVGELPKIQPLDIKLERTAVPLLINSSDQNVFQFQLATNRKRTISKIVLTLVGTTDFSDFQRINIVAENSVGESRGKSIAQWKDPKQPRLKWDCSHDIRPGQQTFFVTCTLNPETDLLNRINISLSSITFADGATWKSGESFEPHRLAYCLHKKRQFNCHTFRIPAIARSPSGTLLAVYDMRYNSARDLQEHIDIGLSRSTDGGEIWTEPVPIMSMGAFGGRPQKENGCSDPGLIVDGTTGEIFVFAVWTHGKPNTHQWVGKGSEPGLDVGVTSQFVMVRSIDDGKTWSPVENLTRKIKPQPWWLFAPAPGNGINLADGTLVMPTQGRDANGRKFSNLMFSRDHGKSWTISKPARHNTSECSVVELSDGRLLLCMRDDLNRNRQDQTNGRAVSTTSDLGKTWHIHSSDHSALPEPVCMASMIGHDLADGTRVLLFSNPNHKRARKNMTIQISFDDGKTWPSDKHILLDELGGAYSSLVMVDDQTVGILYESSRADLVFQKIKLEELLNR